MKFEDYKHGQKVTCKIHDTVIDDAKISIKGHSIYICQNLRDGADSNGMVNKLGYRYSWFVGDGSYSALSNDRVTNLKLVKIGRPAKVKQARFFVFYEKNGIDPLVTFADRPSLSEWLKKAKDDSSIKWSSIRVVEGKELKLELKTRVKLS